nr:MAG TPA: tail protein [Caudoviricetes sp.]
MLRDLEVVGIKQYFDVNSLYEQPVMELCNPNKKQLTIYSEVQDLKLTLRFASVSEMTFTIYKDEKRGDMQFELTRKQRLIHVEGIGYFVIVNVNENHDSGTPYKEVTAYSAEFLLNYKPLNVSFTSVLATTTYSRSYKFYDFEYPEDTLMYKLFNGFYDWKFDDSNLKADADNGDTELIGKYRTFSDTGDGLYGFLQNYVSASFECVFIYDIENFTVSAYKLTDVLNYTDVILTFDNLMQSAQIEELPDDICTVLAVSGANSLSLASVNPTGTNNIYKFDYYLTDEWLGKDVHAQDKEGNIRKCKKNGDIIHYDTGVNYATGEPILFADYVKAWESDLKEAIMHANEEGSYAWLVSRYARLYGDACIVDALIQGQQATYEQLVDAVTTFEEEEEKKAKKVKTKAWIGLGLGLLFVAAAVTCVFFPEVIPAIATGLTSVATSVGLGVTVTEGMVAGAMGAMGIAGVQSIGTNLSTLVATSTAIKCSKQELIDMRDNAAKNVETLKNGGDYITNISVETATKAMFGISGTTYKNTLKKISWISNTYKDGNESNIYQLKPTDTGKDEGSDRPYYCASTYQKKMEYIRNKYTAIVEAFKYTNYFSPYEQEILEPFIVTSEYSDEGFSRTDDIDIEDNANLTKSIMTTQGIMTVQEFKYHENGWYTYFISKYGKNMADDPITFNREKFISFVGLKENQDGKYLLEYNGSSWNMEGDKVQKNINLSENIGLKDNTSLASYHFDKGDTYLVKIFNKKIELVNSIQIAIQLAEQAYSVLDKCCEPSFSFSLNTGNYLFQEKFKSWHGTPSLGAVATVVLNDAMILQPYIQEIAIDYNNSDTLDLTFGNKFKIGTAEFTLGDLIANNTSVVDRTQRSLVGTTNYGGYGNGAYGIGGTRTGSNGSGGTAGSGSTSIWATSEVQKKADENAAISKKAQETIDKVNNDLSVVKDGFNQFKQQTNDTLGKYEDDANAMLVQIGSLNKEVTTIKADYSTKTETASVEQRLTKTIDSVSNDITGKYTKLNNDLTSYQEETRSSIRQTRTDLSSEISKTQKEITDNYITAKDTRTLIQQTNDSIMLSVSQKYYGKNQTDNSAIISLVGSGLKVDGTSITQYVKSTNTAVEQVKRDKKDTVYHSCYGSSGVNGYLHFAQIKINSTYQNRPITFELSNRSQQCTWFSITFKNANSIDPEIQSFVFDGTIQIYTKRVASGTWKLFARKSEGYDEFYINEYNNNNANTSITWLNELTSTMPTGAVSATQVYGRVLEKTAYDSVSAEAKLGSDSWYALVNSTTGNPQNSKIDFSNLHIGKDKNSMTLGTAAQNINTHATKITSMEQTLDGFKWSVQAASSNNAWPDPYFIGIASKQSMWSGHVEYKGWNTNPYQTFMYMWGRDHLASGYPIPVTAGNTYRIKCNWIRGSGSLSLRAGLWGGKQSSNGSIDWGNGYNLGYHELIAQDAIGSWSTGYTEVTVPSQFNTACLFFQIEQGADDIGTTFYVTNVTVTDTTQSQFVQQHMTFDSSGLRVYGNDTNKCVLINDAGVRIQRDSANRVEVNSGSINLVVGNKNSISLHTNNISLYGGRNNLYDSDGVLAGFIGVGNANWPTASGYGNITHGIALASSDRSDSGVFLMDGKNKSIVVAHANSDNSTVLYNINSILTKSGYYGAKYILRYLTYDTPGFGDIPEHYAYYFAGILVGVSNSVPSGYPVLMTSGGVASVWSYNSGGKII